MPRTAGVPNATNKDKSLLLKVVKKVLPLGSDHWKVVEMKYNKLHAAESVKNGSPTVERSAHTLKHLFYSLAEKKKPTGESIQSDLIREAKKIEEMIQRKICGVRDGTTDDEEEEDAAISILETEEDDLFSEDSDDDADDEVESPAKKVSANRFRVIGDALGNDLPRRSKTTPVSRFERKKTQASLDTSIVSLVDIMKEHFSNRRESEQQHQSSGASTAAQLNEMKEEIGGLRSMIQLMMEQFGVVAVPDDKSSDEADGGANKRQRRE